MQEITAIVEVELVPGREEEALEALRALIEATHANDEGCLLYAAHRVADEPTKVVMVERWASPQSLEAHGQTDHVAAAMGHDAFTGQPKMTMIEGLGFGTDAQGRID